MKRCWICIAVFLLCFCGIHSAKAATTEFGSKTSFTLEGNAKEFYIENPGAVSADDYFLGYKKHETPADGAERKFLYIKF